MQGIREKVTCKCTWLLFISNYVNILNCFCQINVFLNRLNGEPIGVSVLGIFVIDKNTILTVCTGCTFILIFLTTVFTVRYDVVTYQSFSQKWQLLNATLCNDRS